MASLKAIAAIALTLMIAAPIGMGYLFASENVDVTYWDDVGTANLSNEILNYETPIYGIYEGPNNNSYLSDASGLSPTYSRVDPDYNEISANYTALPVYTTESRTFTLTAGTSGSYSLNNQSVGNTGSGATYVLGSQPYQYLGISDYTGVLTLTIDGTAYTFSLGNTVVALKNGDTYTIYTYAGGIGNTYEDVTTWKVGISGTASVSYYVRDYTDLNIVTDYSMQIKGASSVKITHTNGTVEYATPYRSYSTLLTSNTTLTYNSPGFFHITTANGTETYSNVSSVSVASYSTNGTVTYSATFPDGTFASPAYGWKMPVDTVRWYNNFENESVRMMLKLEMGDSLTFYIPGTSGNYVVERASGDVTLEGLTLGTYTYLMLDIGMEQITLSGLSGWPALSQDPEIVLNTVTVDYTIAASTPFEYVQIYVDGTPDLRVDRASVAMGTFPSTKNFNLDLDGLFPGKSFTLKFNSIGVYGDYLVYGNDTYVVNNGKITVNDRAVSLKGATFSAHENAGEYTLYINGMETGTLPSAPILTFGGEWSLTVTSTLQEQKTEQRAQWAAGQFAFDKTDFAACGLLVAGACLVGLGMYGQRSGIKMGLLLLICGGAALIYLTFV